MPPKKKYPSAHEYMRRSGKRSITLWMTEAEKELLEQAAALDRRSVTQFVVIAATEAAEKRLKQR